MAERGGLLNRCRGLNPYRGFESLSLRQVFTAPIQRAGRTRLRDCGWVPPDGLDCAGGSGRQAALRGASAFPVDRPLEFLAALVDHPKPNLAQIEYPRQGHLPVGRHRGMRGY